MSAMLSWLISVTIEAWDDWRDPDWKEVYDPYTDSIRNPTPRQIEKMYGGASDAKRTQGNR